MITLRKTLIAMTNIRKTLIAMMNLRKTPIAIMDMRNHRRHQLHLSRDNVVHCRPVSIVVIEIPVKKYANQNTYFAIPMKKRQTETTNIPILEVGGPLGLLTSSFAPFGRSGPVTHAPST